MNFICSTTDTTSIIDYRSGKEVGRFNCNNPCRYGVDVFTNYKNNTNADYIVCSQVHKFIYS